MKAFCYHIHAIYDLGRGSLQHFDGIVRCNTPIVSQDELAQVREGVARGMRPPVANSAKVIIDSLSYLGQWD